MRVTLLLAVLRYANLRRMELRDYIDEQRGRASALGRALRVSPVLVSQWASKSRPVPADRCPSIERATNGVVRCEELRPDVDWGVLRSPLMGGT
ncbi:transcriptional regulator [Chitiniphilus eburneus]|uniref:transcriptional regulator n=1 Tax=Chitiniphilus eburneus TaxID=2571148 RepID=UPI0035CFEC41